MKKILTIILDGFGMRESSDGNAIKNAKMKNFESLWKDYPHSLLDASGKAVGLEEGQFGNSEVGHTTIGAGFLPKQNEEVVTDFLTKGYEENEMFLNMLENTDKHFHIMGLFSDGSVHSNLNHYFQMFDILVNNGIRNIHFHIITDGRDTDVMAANSFIEKLELKIKNAKVGDIASVCGRYYAMDRDENYDRTKIYYDLVTKGVGIGAIDPKKSITSSYEKEITDEFIKPIICNLNNKIKDGDVLLWMNYRADRAKQILKAFKGVNFDGFNTFYMPNLEIYSFLPVDKTINMQSFTVPSEIKNPLGVYLSKLGLTQARVAESEKYPHVTYFFDGGYEGKLDGCNKIEVPSPEVPTYDLKPEMSAVEVTKKIIKCMELDFDFILVNFANPDMVGHTGDYEAATKACMAIDVCLGKILEVAEDNFYKVILLADHGNADTMFNEDETPCTTHTIEKVPFIIKDTSVELKPLGDLTMVAPTILNYMDIAVPKEMIDTPILFKERDV